MTVSQPDLTALRHLAIAFGAVLAAACLVLEEVRLQAITTDFHLNVMVTTLAALYVLRRRKNRR